MHPDVIAERLAVVAEDLKEIRAKLDTHYVTHHEFRPVKMIVYGMVGGVLMSVLTAVLVSVVRASI